MSTEPTDKKIIVDEDWKSQVEAEREAARREEAGEKPAAEPQPARDGGGAMPPANLAFLVGTIYIQGAMALGVLMNPATKKAEVQLPRAKHAIDLLAMLQEKTEGHRTPEESETLETALHELRMAFVTASR